MHTVHKRTVETSTVASVYIAPNCLSIRTYSISIARGKEFKRAKDSFTMSLSFTSRRTVGNLAHRNVNWYVDGNQERLYRHRRALSLLPLYTCVCVRFRPYLTVLRVI